MAILAAIFEFLVGLVKAVPYIDKWFSKTPTEKVEEGREDVRKETDHMRDTGRPS
jgi:hypothetical protein